MELEGYKRVHSELTSNGLIIDKLVTDRHRQLAKYVREETPEILHMYDVWHVAKGEDILAYYKFALLWYNNTSILFRICVQGDV